MLLALLRTTFYTAALLASTSLLILLIGFILLRQSLALARPKQRKQLVHSLQIQDSRRKRIIGFFHPYCNAGGGGERVLWTALACMQREEKDAVFVVYTGDVGEGKGRVSKEEILDKVANRFGVRLSPSTLHFVPLRKRFLVEDSTWPRFTLIGQSIGSIFLAYEGLGGKEGVVPDVWIDTMGYAFSYPLVKYLLPTVPIGSYTHYPTISTDMLNRVRLRQAGHTNPSHVARSRLLSTLKLGYYSLFASAYSWSLARADLIMVNSTWTKRHIDSLLGSHPPSSSASDALTSFAEEASSLTLAAKAQGELRRRSSATVSTSTATSHLPSSATSPSPSRPQARIVYPPCDTSSLSSLPLFTVSRTSTSSPPRTTIFSLAQFRPEKEHPTQFRALAKVFELAPEYRGRVRLVCAGSVRNEEDEGRVEALRELAKELGLSVAVSEGEAADVEFLINAPWPMLAETMGKSSIGLHTMVDEHFGIGVVEFQAAGLIPLAHASAGPLLDIVVPYPPVHTSTSTSTSTFPSLPSSPTGFLASSPSSPSDPDLPTAFATQLLHILRLPVEEQDHIRERARKNAVERFSEAVFEEGWRVGMGELSARGKERTE
ncbi:hypothetical protein JCM11251_006924 [Rhodosporidiobolus azoricus]